MAKRDHITMRGDGKAWVVAFRQAKNKEYPRVYRSFNFDRYEGETLDERKLAAKEDAKLFEAQEMAKQARGLTTHATPKVIFEEAANRWHANGVAKGWRTSTANDYRSCLDGRLLREFGNEKLAELTEQRVEEWLETLRNEVSARTVQKLLFVGGAVCQRAHHDWPGYTANPFREIEKALKAQRAPIQTFTQEEAAAIVRAAESEQDGCIFLLAWRTGVRRGEIPPLLVGDVDFLGRTLHVRRNFVQGVITTPKGKRERTVPLNKSLARALENLLRERGDPDDGELLFPGGDDAKSAHDPEKLLGRGQDVDGLLDPEALRRRFKAAMETAGVKRELSLKHLRHTYCSHLAASGVSPWRIQEWAGHASITTTQLYVEVFAPKPDHANTVDAAYGDEEEPPTSGDDDSDDDVVERLQYQLAEMAETLARMKARTEA